ncbi:hypothetical protein [Thermocatellispora tengchongensis]|uniref:hypothetical protein n=1 Tax=Thermocatellispora tengchongensis TaxID=1073253 RepID=UPI003632271C
MPIASLAWGWIRLAPLTVWSFVGGGALLGVAYKALDVVGVDLFQDVLDPDRFEGCGAGWPRGRRGCSSRWACSRTCWSGWPARC